MITPELKLETAKEVIELWYHYEEIAMHFNQLIIQYRLQLMGGVGALATIASYLIGEKMKDSSKQKDVKVTISTTVLLLLMVAGIMDVFYYSVLLEGAVKTLTDFEEKYPFIKMSTNINKYVGPYRHLVSVCYGFLIAAL